MLAQRHTPLLLACLMVLPACTRQVIYSTWSDLHALADRRGGAGQNRPADRLADRQWSIQMCTFRGPDRHRAAATLVKQLGQERLDNLWVGEQEDRVTLMRGRFADPGGGPTRAALEQCRKIRLEGRYPFEDARLVPVADLVAGGNDLKQFASQSLHTALYTLQVEAYDLQVGARYRKVAEGRAGKLRVSGQKAFFYHGPHLSIVTLGLFTRAEAFVSSPLPGGGVTEVYAPAVRQLQRKYPYNLMNGRTLVEKAHGQKVRDQPSFLVRVP